MPEVIVATSKDGGEELVSAYDAGFALLRQGRLRPEAHVAGGGEWQAPTLSFPYLVVEGGNNPSARSVLRRVDLESGADELVFTGDTARGIGSVLANPTIGGYLFAYNQPIGPGHGEGSAVIELWSASPDSAERIRFEDSYLAVMSDAETDKLENPGGPPLADIRPLAVTPDGRYLLFARQRLYVLELASGKVEQLGTRYGATMSAKLSPDGTRVAVRFQDFGSSDPEAVRLAIVELGSGRAQDVQLPGPLETGDGVWHPDGKRLACTGVVKLYVPKAGDGPRGALVGVYSAVFIVDPGTGEARAIARDPSAPSAPPRAEDFRIPQDYRGHAPLGFSRDGRILFVKEHYAVPNPGPTATTSAVFEEGPPLPPSRHVLLGEVVAVDVETNRREGVLTEVDTTLLVHR